MGSRRGCCKRFTVLSSIYLLHYVRWAASRRRCTADDSSHMQARYQVDPSRATPQSWRGRRKSFLTHNRMLGSAFPGVARYEFLFTQTYRETRLGPRALNATRMAHFYRRIRDRRTDCMTFFDRSPSLYRIYFCALNLGPIAVEMAGLFTVTCITFKKNRSKPCANESALSSLTGR